jgi:hypothetical protein
MKAIFISLLIIISFNLKSYSQVDDFPYFVFFDDAKKIELKSYEGRVFTKSNETIIGMITLFSKLGKTDVVKINQKDTVIRIPYSQISHITIFKSDRMIFDNDTTSFYFFGGNPKLYRLLAEGQVKLFDNLPYIIEKAGSIGNEIFVLENDKLKNTFNFWGINTKRDLVRYLNKKTNKKYPPSKFKNTKDLIKYIATQKT